MDAPENIRGVCAFKKKTSLQHFSTFTISATILHFPQTPMSSFSSVRRLSTMLTWATIWAGIFWVPYAFAQAGGQVSLAMLIIVAGSTLLTNLLLARVVMQSTNPQKDLVGLFRAHLPQRAGNVASVLTIIAFFIYMLVYIRLGPSFLKLITGDSLPLAAATILYVGSIAFLMRKKLAQLSRIEHPLVSLLLLLFVLCICISLYARPEGQTLLSSHPNANIILPYGVLLYALNGVQAVPLLCIVAKEQNTEQHIRKSIFLSRILCVLIVWWFGFAVSGALGAATTQDALHGMKALVGEGFLRISALIWLLAVTSCHVLVGMHARKSLYQHYQYPRRVARALVMAVPLAASLLLHASLIEIISFAGGILTGCTGLWISWLVWRVLQDSKYRFLHYAAVLIAWVYLSGIILTTIQ